MPVKKQPASNIGAQRVSAMQVVQGEDGSFRMGLLTPLELTPDIAILGSGFNTATLRIRSGEHFYFVFREDLVRAGFNTSEAAPTVAAAAR